MESTKDKPLSKEEQAEEEMRNKLQSCGIYEPSMTKKEIEEMYHFISSDTTNASDIEQESTLPLSNDIKESNLSAIENSVQNFPPLKKTTNSDIFRAQSTSSEKPIKSEYSDTVLDKAKNYEKSLKNSIYDHDKNSSSKQETNLFPKSKSDLNIEPKKQIHNKILPATLKILHTEPWKSSLVEKDAVLVKHSPDLIAEMEDYMPDNTEDLDSDTLEELCQKMSEKLDSLEELYIPHLSTSDRKWGSPIKIATKWNGSSEKILNTEKPPEKQNCNSHDTMGINSNDRIVKRKNLCSIPAATYDDSNNENFDNEFIFTKKRKCQQGKKEEQVATKNQEEIKNKQDINSIEMIDVDEAKDILNVESKYSDLQSSFSTDTEFTDQQSEYPRRIPPPNPAKKSFKGPRSKKKNIAQFQNNSIKKVPRFTEERNKNLRESDEEIEDNDCVYIPDEIKPSTVPKSVLSKLQAANLHLEKKNYLNEQKCKAEEEARKQKEKEEALKRDELISKRLQEKEDEISRTLEKERKLSEKEALYKSYLNSQTTRVTRSTFHKSKPSYDETEEDLLLEDDDEPTITHSTLVIQQSCPICHKIFPNDQIISHASECDAFSSDKEENIYEPSTSNTNMTYYQCHICSKYNTSDGNKYEEHVVKCKENAEDNISGICVSSKIF